MKKSIFYLAIALIGFGMMSCSSDDDKGGGNHSDAIVGKWAHKTNTMLINGQGIPMPYDHECATKKDFIEFLTNKRVESTSYADDCTIEYFDQDAKYEINGDILRFYYDDDPEPEEVKILELNGSKLKLKMDEENTEIGVSIELIVEFSRM